MRCERHNFAATAFLSNKPESSCAFTHYTRMSTPAFYVLRLKTFLTPKDLADLAGCTKATICNLARAGKIRGAIRVNPGGKHNRFKDTPEIRNWCAWYKRERERPRPRQSAAGKKQRKRDEKINRLIDIFMEFEQGRLKKPVEKRDKQLALTYFNALAKLAFQRIRFFSRDSYDRMVGGTGGRPQRKGFLPIGDFPLLESIRALDEERLFFRFTNGPSGEPMGKINYIRKIMAALPIRPEARPHSAAPLAKSRTKLSRRARRRVLDN